MGAHRNPDSYVRALLLSRYIANENGCWVYTGPRWGGATGGKYGVVSFHGKSRSAHRVMHILFNGPIPEGMEVEHYPCDFGLCINPAHLRIATHAQNGRTRAELHTHCKRGHKLPEYDGSYRLCRECVIYRRKLHWRKKEGFCKNGHAIEGDNKMILNGGKSLRCRACHLSYQKQYNLIRKKEFDFQT